MVTVAKLVQLTGAEFNGEPSVLDLELESVASLDKAASTQLSFLSDSKYQSKLEHTKAGAVFVTKQDAQRCPVPALVVASPYLAYAQASALFDYQSELSAGAAPSAQIHPTAQVHPTAAVGACAQVGAGAVVEQGAVIESCAVLGDHARLGAHSRLLANAVVHHHCVIGAHCVIHAGAVIGAQGFGFAPKPTATGLEWQPIAQLGTVRIGDFVSVGANTCIDRGAVEDTVIENHVIIDNLVQIAHNVVVGESTAIAACTGVAGSTKIGKRCIIAGGVGIAGHLNIADDVQIAGMCRVTGSIKTKGAYASGAPVQPQAEWRRSAVQFKKLGQVKLNQIQSSSDKIDALTQRIEALESALRNT